MTELSFLVNSTFKKKKKKLCIKGVFSPCFHCHLLPHISCSEDEGKTNYLITKTYSNEY